MSDKAKAEKLGHKKKIVAAMKALSNENRLAMFEYIRSVHGRGSFNDENRLSVCDVAGNFDMALSTISHHMKELRNAGLIKCVRDGQTVH
jgi:ArsR family transcriptional regulator